MLPRALKFTACGWLLWVGGLIAMFVVDLAVRVRQKDLYFGGIPAPMQVLIAAVLGGVALYFLYVGAKRFKPWIRLVIVAGQAVVGLILYAFLDLMYVCNAGIDCL